jgi:hypothetical protein
LECDPARTSDLIRIPKYSLEEYGMRFATIALLAVVLGAVALAEDVSGAWKASMQGPDGQSMELTFNLKADGAKLTGTVTTPMGEMPISEGKVDGDKIEFTVETDQFKVVHKGTFTGDTMKLTVDMGDQKMEMTAKRSAS